ncbi:hypothetical protein ASPWEDRAFT_645290 [Aspergillus wentii DTO 134E9]|uniref:Uncharacterized protein n=1 Tax=Aspergillus wentii DTO 134E9 TaxID=1073089 RepID=A0A1L9RAQ5_ASPWE|nr:uncharacterized protein ASPWEDRAFT_645290 [Aspergillus wentii DTO 134E9]OJJ32004.1 hypothetical protein ASPWEDRAFT_645290 [Aspergillus wentii DTO 134E9]
MFIFHILTTHLHLDAILSILFLSSREYILSIFLILVSWFTSWVWFFWPCKSTMPWPC